MKLYDSALKSKTEFTPEDKHLSLYVCGVTVYDACHIGHARVSVFFDTLVRYFESKGISVSYVRNITDIDDKIIHRAAELGISIDALTEKYIQKMHHDFAELGIRKPTREPRATTHIPDIITLIESLIEKGFAYQASNSDVYYAIEQFADYGKLSHQKIEDLIAGARIDSVADKKNPLDFVLWKAAKTGEPAWPSPWGPGRPGWHIECSAMVKSCLGDTIDIHGGGHDLLFPHHENEIAQSEASCGAPLARHWMHVGFVTIDNEKMSKSLGNFFTIEQVLENFHPEAIRLFLLSSHYRSPLNFSDHALKEAEKALMRLYGAVREVSDADIEKLRTDNICADIKAQFMAAMDDDMNTPVALSVLFECVNAVHRCADTTERHRYRATLIQLGGILGLFNASVPSVFQGGDGVDEQWVAQKIQERNLARQDKNWALADEIRDALAKQGIVLEDKAGETLWRKTTTQ